VSARRLEIMRRHVAEQVAELVSTNAKLAGLSDLEAAVENAASGYRCAAIDRRALRALERAAPH
jgi:hypothetical protein